MIKSITIVTAPGVKQYYVGSDGVTEIKNHSQEYPDHSEYYFSVWAGEKKVADIINCPVEVCHENEDCFLKMKEKQK